MRLVDSGAELTESAIAEFEEQFSIQLPCDYRSFMLKNNGPIRS